MARINTTKIYQPAEQLPGKRKGIFMHDRSYPPVPKGYHIEFRPWRRLPDGRILYASAYGKKAWPILVKDSDKGKTKN